MSLQPRPRWRLQDLLLAPRSLIAYRRALNIFLVHSRLSFHQLLITPPLTVDHLLSAYIQHTYDHDGSYSNAAQALAALVHYRQDVKLLLFSSRQCIKGWARVKKSVSHPPFTWELAVLLACTFARSGYLGPAVSMLVGFDCYLRVSELTRMRRRDVIMPHDPRMGAAQTQMALCLPIAKTGLDQSVVLRNPVVADVLRLWVSHLRLVDRPDSTDRIFDFPDSQLRNLIRNACASLGLGDTPYVPHSLRHGGATADFLRTGDINYVQNRGRWKSMESARRYIQSTRALLAKHQVPAALNQLGAELSVSLLDVMLAAFRSQRRVAFRE